MNTLKTKTDKLEYLKKWVHHVGITPTHNPVVPEWLALRMLHLTPDEFLHYVLLDDCPVKPVYRGGERFYRLEEIAEVFELPR
ncbi:hypothetical protein [Methylophaga sp.]|uniref:hypothetical protein n=1 Tax=Methylophaga sp. TaxID=2024840 RepID=UPI001401239A|nr:hypothetical protein [Methylophaga sp.]MTI64398.1 hypothetical protein [Methylophaga sp.]